MMRRTDGVALIVTMAVALIVGLLVMASALTGLIDRSVSVNQQRSNTAYYTAQAGLERYKTAVFRNLVDYYDEHGTGWCESPVAGGILDSEGAVMLEPGGEPATGNVGDGTYEVSFQVDDTFLVLTSVGTYGDARSTVQLVASAGGGPASAWDNAILAQGAEAGSKAINGNVSVYGSVHIVDGDLDGTLAVGGTSGIYNTYRGEGGADSDIVADVDHIVDAFTDLCARLKVAKGNVYLESGSVQVGTSSEPIYSVHLGEGIVCEEKDGGTGDCKTNREVTNHHDSSSVYLYYPEGEGITSPYSPYDLTLPELEQAAFDRAFATATDDSGVWQPVPGCEWLYDGSGEVVLPPTTLPDPDDPDHPCGEGSNKIDWVGGELIVEGEVNVPDTDLRVTGNVKYRGNGSIIVGADAADTSVTIRIDGASLQPAVDVSYLDPVMDGGNTLALTTSGDIDYESTSSLDPSAVLMYARGTFNALKQPIIVGAVVADAFDLGNQVPKIAYHPNVRLAAERLCLPGTACAEGGTPQNEGFLADIAIERR